MKIDRLKLRYRSLKIPAFILNMINKKYGRLLVCGYAGYNNGSYYVDCICECGNAFMTNPTGLKNATTIGCGCYNREMLKKNVRKTHGESSTRLYKILAGIKKRCQNPNCSRYKFYGGKGIKICVGFSELHIGYIKFRDKLGKPLSDKHSVDRIKSDLHYSCGDCIECKENGWEFNCRWATQAAQTRNRVNCLYVTIAGEKMTAAEADRKLKLPRGTIWHRIRAYGWSEEKAIAKSSKSLL